jgi:ribonucleotide reductase alpha subunit
MSDQLWAPVPWGPIGEIVYSRTYARKKRNGEKENFSETVERELQGIQKQLKLDLSDKEANFYRKMRHELKGSVAGRFMWQLNTDTVKKHGLASLQNCAFVTIDKPIRPFTWAMDMLMLGSGVGFSIQREHVYKLPKLQRRKVKIERNDVKDADYIVPDTREGWVKLLGKVLKSFFYSGEGFTYSCQLIRSQGEPIQGFGGEASGPGILEEGISNIINILDNRRGKQLRPIDCLDIMCIIGGIVKAGNIRRSALIAIGDYDDLEYLKAKRWSLGNIPPWRGNSNNSIAVHDASALPQEFWDTYEDGEPYGLINLELARSVGRLGETEYPDPTVEGFNPCAEQGLAPYETCCLAEVFLSNIESEKELWEVVKMLYKVNKHSLALKSHHPETQKVVHENMRMGIGMTGVMMASEEQLSWLDGCYRKLRAFDKKYSKKMGWPESVKLTTVKPSGTLSLLPGLTPGVHPAPSGKYYIRRVTVASDSPLVEQLKRHGYYGEFALNIDGTENRTSYVFEFPVEWPDGTKTQDDVTVFEQLDMVRFMQKNWSDNSVSVTAYYNREDIPEIKKFISAFFKDNFKTLSFLLKVDHGFKQAPYETISKDQYEYISSKIRPMGSISIDEEEVGEFEACGIGGCPIK